MSEPLAPDDPTPARTLSTRERLVGVCFALTALAAVALAVVYALGGQPQAEGSLLAVALGSTGIGLVAWAKELFGEREETDERPMLVSEGPARAEFVESLERSEATFGRRTALVKLLGVAGGALGLAALFPLRSLGPTPGRALFRTSWRSGARLVTDAGRPVRADELDVGAVLTVFPEGGAREEDSATLLIKVTEADLRPRHGREDWAPRGNVAYSKICTHVGCPVGLYRETTQELLCPCHQSTFDVLDGARPVFGPATRSLPQLPLDVDEQGYLVARSDYQEPIGPGFWNRERG